MRLLQQFGVCDCHSHVFGPFAQFPLSPKRTFDPPQAPIEALEAVWQTIGMDRAVLVQGSAHGQDPAAMLDAIARAPETRHGVALLSHEISDEKLADLHAGGVRAARFNWISHLLGGDLRTNRQRLDEAAVLLEKVARLGWHAEVHIDVADLYLLDSLDVPEKMPVVVDHMARVDLSAADANTQLNRLLVLLKNDRFWVKVSGADRLTAKLERLDQAIDPMREVIAAVPHRCVWGLDWPHVNLERKPADMELAALLCEVATDESTLVRLLIQNPQQLYGFPSTNSTSTTGE